MIKPSAEAINTITISRIKEILPQAYPFLMIDRVVEFKKGESLTAVKNITADEWMFDNHANPSGIFPETLIIEAAAQAALAFFILNQWDGDSAKPQVLLGRAKAEFLKSVQVGDELNLQVMSYKEFGKSGYSSVHVSVAQQPTAQVEIYYSLKY